MITFLVKYLNKYRIGFKKKYLKVFVVKKFLVMGVCGYISIQFVSELQGGKLNSVKFDKYS